MLGNTWQKESTVPASLLCIPDASTGYVVDCGSKMPGNLFKLDYQFLKKRPMSVGNNSTPQAVLIPSSIEGEMERLRREIYRPDMEKLKLFTQMLRTNVLYAKAKVTHK
jgi:hypothetical protein